MDHDYLLKQTNFNSPLFVTHYVPRKVSESFRSRTQPKMITHLEQISGNTWGLLWYAQRMLGIKEKSEHLKHETKKFKYDPDHK